MTRKSLRSTSSRQASAFEVNSESSILQYRKFHVIYKELKHSRQFPEQKQTISFMDLPPELRLIVYRYHLVLDDPMEMYAIGRRFKRQDQKERLRKRAEYQHMVYSRNLNLSLLRTCRIIRNEAVPIFYGENEFRFSDSMGSIVAYGFLYKIGSFNRQWLTSITIPIPFEQVSDRRTYVDDDFNVTIKTKSLKEVCSTAPYRFPRKAQKYLTVMGRGRTYANVRAFWNLARYLSDAPRLSTLRMIFTDDCRTNKKLNEDHLVWIGLEALFNCIPFLPIELIHISKARHYDSVPITYNQLKNCTLNIRPNGIPGFPPHLMWAVPKRFRVNLEILNTIRFMTTSTVKFGEWPRGKSSSDWFIRQGYEIEDTDSSLEGLEATFDGLLIQ